MDNVLVLNDHILPLPTTPFGEFRLSNQLQMSFRSVFLDHSSQGVQTRETRTFRNGYGLTVTSRQHNRFKIVRRGGKKKKSPFQKLEHIHLGALETQEIALRDVERYQPGSQIE